LKLREEKLLVILEKILYNHCADLYNSLCNSCCCDGMRTGVSH